MAVTEGKYQTAPPNPDRDRFGLWYVMNTQTGVPIAYTRNEAKATYVANALNFNHKPSEYGYYLNTEKDAGR